MLCLLLSLYAFGVFGYVTATIATFFIGRDAESSEAELAGSEQIRQLMVQIADLRDELRVSVGGSPRYAEKPESTAPSLE